jgi:hypothetical protein
MHDGDEMKPVAWIINGHLFEEYFKTSELDKIIPLYPSPRELSDEEIAVIWANFGVPMTGMEFKKVVEAILKKASEK